MLAAVAALMGAATGSGLLESIPFIGKGLDVFESAWQVSDALVSTLLGLLILAGAVLAYVLPALPFIRFLFGILGWILNVAVAVLAVTVFAAAHVTREDGGRLITNATRQGWLFLPALVLRPALMLLGLILGYFVFLAAIGLFNQVWLPQMRDAGASGGLGPVGFLAMLALYVIVAYGLINASFKLIDLLPVRRPRLDRRARGRRRRRRRADRRRGRRRHLAARRGAHRHPRPRRPNAGGLSGVRDGEAIESGDPR